MVYQPNIWLMEDLHRRIVSAARQFENYTLLLRPTRRHIFLRMFKVEQKVKEFFRPCFCVLAEKNDPDKKPCMVIETDSISEEMSSLYEQHGVLWASVKQEQNRFVLDCSHRGTRLRVEEQTGSLFKLLSAPLSWYERNVSFPQGSFVHNYSERVLSEAIKILSPNFRIECHHQVPLSWVLGVKPDLCFEEKKLLGSEIDTVIIQSFEADPDGTVVLPIKLDLHDSHQEVEQVIMRDNAIRTICEKYGVPLLTITAGENQTYHFNCPILGRGTEANEQSADAWARALAPFLGSAIKYAGRGF